jgi:hypothetical protein
LDGFPPPEFPSVIHKNGITERGITSESVGTVLSEKEYLMAQVREGNDGLLLVFRSGEQYIFALGDSTKTLPVRLASAAIGLFRSHGIGADDLARLAA